MSALPNFVSGVIRLCATGSVGSAVLAEGGRPQREYAAATLDKRRLHLDSVAAIHRLGSADKGRTMMRTLRKSIVLFGLLLASALVHANTVTYVYTDPQGTPLAEADAQGNITTTFDYAPYGSQALGTPPNGPGYTGHVNDPETGLVYMQARYYDPSVGRFLSVDPAGMGPANVFSFNRYDYVNNNPAANIDPFGTTCTSSVTGRYNCTVDSNSGHFSRSQLSVLNKAYTKAVNTLASHSGRTVTVSINGKNFQANAGMVARALSGAHVDTSAAHGDKTGKATEDDRASTYGGGIGSNGRSLQYQPQTTVYLNAIEHDRSGGEAHLSRDLSLTFVHEGIHMLPGESVMYHMYYVNPAKYRLDHQKSFNKAASDLFKKGE